MSVATCRNKVAQTLDIKHEVMYGAGPIGRLGAPAPQKRKHPMGGMLHLGSMACVLVLGTAAPAAAQVVDSQGIPVRPLALLQFSQSGTTADVAVLQQAQVLLGSGQAAQAYEMLSTHEADWAGIPLYDYLLGIAALDTGR